MQKIPLAKNMAYANQHVKDDFSKLTDGFIGEVNSGTKFTVWNQPIKPYIITFDLSDFENCKILQLKYYNNTGNPSTLKYYYVRKDNGQKVLIKEYKGGSWIQAYQSVDVLNSVDASFFIIESGGGDDFPDDFELWGDFTLKILQPSTRPRSPLSDLMGVVCKPWDIASDYIFPEKIPALLELKPSRIRLYNDYELNHDPAGNFYIDHNLWHQTANMKTLKAAGVSTQMCYLATPYYPFPVGAARLNTDTYVQLGKDIYSWGVHNKANGEYFKTIEVENEINRWYGANPSIEYMDGYELAALMSVCFDGHKGKYPNTGLKASGSAALVSVPGMAEGEPYILYQMLEWSKANRGYRADGTVDLPFDIYSFHCYSSLEGQRQGIAGGISPEYGMLDAIQKTDLFRKRYAPWMKIHIGEWGWDISPYSPLNAPAFEKFSAHQVSAMWTIRALLAMAENGIDASSYYRIKQDYDAGDDNSYIIFATMALLRFEAAGTKQDDGSYTGMIINRTLTGDYFKQVSQLFSEGWVFDSRISTSPNVLKLKKGTSEMYVIWETETMTITDRPQFTERTGTYNLNVKGKLRRFVDNGSGVMSTEDFAGGSIAYGSKPVFVIVDSSVIATPPPLPAKQLFLTGHVYTDKTISTAKSINTKKTLLTNIRIYDDGSVDSFK